MYLFSVFISIIYLSTSIRRGGLVSSPALSSPALGEDTHGQDSDRGGHVTDMSRDRKARL